MVNAGKTWCTRRMLCVAWKLQFRFAIPNFQDGRETKWLYTTAVSDDSDHVISRSVVAVCYLGNYRFQFAIPNFQDGRETQERFYTAAVLLEKHSVPAQDTCECLSQTMLALSCNESTTCVVTCCLSGLRKENAQTCVVTRCSSGLPKKRHNRVS